MNTDLSCFSADVQKPAEDRGTRSNNATSSGFLPKWPIWFVPCAGQITK